MLCLNIRSDCDITRNISNMTAHPAPSSLAPKQRNYKFLPTFSTLEMQIFLHVKQQS